jgi:NADPH oxidase 5
MDENGMKFSETQIDDLTRAMFDDADTENKGSKLLESMNAR